MWNPFRKKEGVKVDVPSDEASMIGYVGFVAYSEEECRAIKKKEAAAYKEQNRKTKRKARTGTYSLF